MRDVPEVAALALLGAGALTAGFYTFHREMLTPAGESFPSKEVRRDPDLQVAATASYHNPSLFYRVAQLNTDEWGFNSGIFDNRTRPFEYNFPTQGLVHSGPQHESAAAAQPGPM
ncbi:hypothetical protein TSOC_004368 [Tetrabaena socialis]|uniref:Uncharacterized protein n=1 Tax=Tetrabaena socialis TaxID=47790 RepID=A0A2J8A962_9CHLO|nr:hypothetical protein TSOC_004368 [Tetrabaena socialis]|eukprot:PNH09035.1 hypothetical protein TSOC_004368 [Tetrabaena socialis]